MSPKSKSPVADVNLVPTSFKSLQHGLRHFASYSCNSLLGTGTKTPRSIVLKRPQTFFTGLQPRTSSRSCGGRCCPFRTPAMRRRQKIVETRYRISDCSFGGIVADSRLISRVLIGLEYLTASRLCPYPRDAHHPSRLSLLCTMRKQQLRIAIRALRGRLDTLLRHSCGQ